MLGWARNMIDRRRLRKPASVPATPPVEPAPGGQLTINGDPVLLAGEPVYMR